MIARRIPTLLLLLVFSASGTAAAAPLDAAATRKIAEAINVHYLATDFRNAEAILKGTVKACGTRCSEAVIAKAWMYVGIVRGAGNNDVTGAKRAFAEALVHDAAVRLDQDLATDGVRKAFEEAGGDPTARGASLLGTSSDPAEATQRAPKTERAAAARQPATPSASTPMQCSPIVSEVQTLRPIPLTCRSSTPAAKLVIYYKGFGAPAWTSLNMSQVGPDWSGTIPCSGTTIQGTLKWYAVAEGDARTPLESFGSKLAPIEISIVKETEFPPPALPGIPPPTRCADMGDCPEEMRGTPACPGRSAAGSGDGKLGWGSVCEDSSQCQEGLYCLGGSCDVAPACETDDDCSEGSCNGTVCEIDGDSSPDADGPNSFFSVQFGADLSLLSGEGVCNPHPANGSDWDCFLGDTPYSTPARDPAGFANDPTLSGSFGSSVVPGTVRAMIAYEYVFGGHFGVEAQVGMAFINSPAATTADLFHAALRGKYWFTGTGEGLRPFVSVGGGLGEVNARKNVSTLEWYEPTPEELVAPIAEQYPDAATDPQQAAALQQAQQDYLDSQINNYGYGQGRGAGYDLVCSGLITDQCVINPVNAWIRLGSSFVSGSVGAMLNLGSFGITAEAQAKFMVPVSGIVLQPTVGAAFGF